MVVQELSVEVKESLSILIENVLDTDSKLSVARIDSKEAILKDLVQDFVQVVKSLDDGNFNKDEIWANKVQHFVDILEDG